MRAIYSDAQPEPTAIVDAIRHGRVEVVTRPLSWIELLRFLRGANATLHTVREALWYMQHVLRRTRASERSAAQRAADARDGHSIS